MAARLFQTIDVLVWPGFFILIPTIIMGASFPIVSSLADHKLRGEGRALGRVYFVNVTGNVAGGAVTGFILLPLLGTEWSLLCFSTSIYFI